GPAAAAQPPPAVPVVVADNITAAGVGLFVALERGYFTAEGLDVTLERVGNQADIFTQLAAGRFDVAGSPSGPALFTARPRGLRQGQLQRLVGSEDPTGVVHAASVITYGEEFIAQKPEAAERFMVAYVRAIRDNYEAFFGGGRGREAVVAALVKYTPVKDPSL